MNKRLSKNLPKPKLAENESFMAFWLFSKTLIQRRICTKSQMLVSILAVLLMGFPSNKQLFAQSGTFLGFVRDRDSQELLIGATVTIENIDPIRGDVTGVDGSYRILAPVGSYNLKASFVGYKDIRKFNVPLSSGNENVINFELERESTTLNEVVVNESRSAAVATVESPLSVQRLTTEEIKSNPGGNFDVSRVIQSLPGVSTSPGGVRNDIIIRGGAPNENVFYLDGIEVPVINHFSTQGSSGGPQGILNLSFIEDVKLNTSAFNARYDNPLSSVFQFTQKEGNRDRIQGNTRLSGTEFAATFDGPISKKTTFLASARKSYLEYLFQLIDLPIRPDYWDFQFKITHKFNAKTTLTSLGVGAIDKFSFAVPKNSSPDKEYALRSNPLIHQNSYTLGLALKRLISHGYLNISVSRNYLSNRLDKFEDGKNNVDSLRTLKLVSSEIENKFKWDVNIALSGWKFSYGMMAQYVTYNGDFFSKVRQPVYDNNGLLLEPGLTINSNSDLNFWKFGGFAQATKLLFHNRLSISGGIRSDINSFTNKGKYPLRTLSPRISFSYALNDQFNLNASIGRYYKIPIYTVLGYKDSSGNFVNKGNDYIYSDHYVGGIEYLPNDGFRVTLEGFYKNYFNYPVSLTDGTSLANQGSTFGYVGYDTYTSNGKGKSFGVELFIQKKLTKKTFYILSYTLYKSEFSGADGKLIPSAWDNRNLVSMLLGYKLGRGFEIGLKYRFAGGAPYTPFDTTASRANYISLGTGVPDVHKLNANRLNNFQQFDFRIDKKWNYSRFTLDLFLDVQNAFMFKTPGYPEYTFQRNSNGTYRTTDGNPIKSNGQNAIPVILKNDDPFFLPSIGFILEF